MKILDKNPFVKSTNPGRNESPVEARGTGAGVGTSGGDYPVDAWTDELDPAEEDSYWRQHYSGRPYVAPGETYDSFESAYRTGYESYGNYLGQSFDEVEDDLRQDYARRAGGSSLTWEKVREAARDAWQRVEDYTMGESDGDWR
jgi:hypothetical protein